MESEEELAIGDIQDISVESPEHREIGGFSEEELALKGSTDDSKDDFNLNVSLAILEAETDEIDAEFHDALIEIEGKKSFPCPSCDKICKSIGGLTKHTNAKHRETSELLPSSESDMTLDCLTGIIEAIKTGLITEDLYGSEINKHIKSASCSKDLFDAVVENVGYRAATPPKYSHSPFLYGLMLTYTTLSSNMCSTIRTQLNNIT